MCVIAIKPSDVDIPSEEKLKLMWDKNSDGAGYMYTLGKRVHITKGYMTFNDFKVSLNLLKEQLEGEGTTFKDLPMVFHFRITTHGGTSEGNTHPFPLSNEEKFLKALDVSCNIGMAHNGVISTLDKEADFSDTQIYIRDIIYELSKTGSGFLERFSKIVDLTKGYSKLAFLDNTGKITMFGNFSKLEEDDGLMYSNTLFEKRKDVISAYNYRDNYMTDYKSRKTKLDINKYYMINDELTKSKYYKEYKNKRLALVDDEETYYGFAQFYVEESKNNLRTIYLDTNKVVEHPDGLVDKDLIADNFECGSAKCDVENNKNNIGGPKCEETRKITQNANRKNYKHTHYNKLKLIKVPKKTLLIDSATKDYFELGDMIIEDDVKVIVDSHNWFYSKDERSYYYQQKDGSLMQINNYEVCAEMLIDLKGFSYLGYIEGTYSQLSKVFTDVNVYSIIK